MKVQCPNCKANYQIDPSKIPAIPEGGIAITCPKCKGKIVIRSEAKPPEQKEAPDQIIPCPDCGHINISTTTCKQCGKVFTKEEIEKSVITLSGET